MAQWVGLRPVFEICAGDTGYEGGGHKIEVWWHQGAADEQLWATLEEILRGASGRRQWEGKATQ